MSEQSHFFAQLSRMPLIQRWPLMRNIEKENISEHSLHVAFIAHALALLHNKKFGGNYNPEQIAVMAMFHDASEVLTGDLPTPIKYYNENIAREYKKIELAAEQRLISYLPEELQDEYTPLIDSEQIDKKNYHIVKQADCICAYLKCLQELAAGNKEFARAKVRLEEMIVERTDEAVRYFLDTFVASYTLSLDEIN